MDDLNVETREDVAVLKQQMQTLMGNGRPGKIAEIEDTLNSIKWWLIIGTLIGGSVTHAGTDYLIKILVK